MKSYKVMAVSTICMQVKNNIFQVLTAVSMKGDDDRGSMYLPLKRRSTATRLHGVISQRTIICIIEDPAKMFYH
jgi:hypothetical protein